MIESLKDKSGSKEVLVIELHPGAAVGGPRTKGFVDEIKKHSDYKIAHRLTGTTRCREVTGDAEYVVG